MQDESAWCAALYLLTSDLFLWSKAEAAVHSDLIDFSSIHIHGVDLDRLCFVSYGKGLIQRNQTHQPVGTD